MSLGAKASVPLTFKLARVKMRTTGTAQAGHTQREGHPGLVGVISNLGWLVGWFPEGCVLVSRVWGDFRKAHARSKHL